MGDAVSDLPPLPPGFVPEGQAALPPLPPGFVHESGGPSIAFSGSDAGTPMENLLAMYGRGVAELGQGVKQLGLHAGGALGLADPETVKAYDEKVKREAGEYAKDLGTKPGGSVLPMAAQIVTTAPIGGIEAAGIEAAAPAVNAALRSAAVGAATGAIQPVEDGDYATTKAEQVGLGGLAGGVASPIIKGLGHLAEMALPSNATKALLNVAAKREQNVNPEFVKESERLADETGVMLSPAQVTGSKPGQMAENAARQSIFSRGIANEGDRARIGQLKDYYDRTLGGISQSDASPELVGNQVRAATNNVIKGLQDWREKTAAEDFGKIRAMTKGQAAIQPENTNTLLQSIFNENAGIGTPGGDALANFAKKQLNNVNPTAAATAGKIGTPEATQAAGLTAPAQGNLDKLMQLRSYLSKVASGQAKISGENQDRAIAAKLLGSIDQDIDAAGEQIGGDLGGALKLANARYRESSQQIDSVRMSPLGKLLGQDVAGAMQAGEFNTLAPEKVAERLYGMKPSEIATVKGLLEQDQPEAWKAIKAGYLQNAMEKASMQAPSEGANVSTFVPSKLVGALTPDQYSAKRLSALFDPAELSQINNIVAVGRRLGDKTGYNFSGTAPMGEALGVMNQIKEGAKQGLTMAALKTGASAISPILGTRALAKAMTDSEGRAALLQLQRLPAGSAQARQLSAWLAANYGAEQP